MNPLLSKSALIPVWLAGCVLMTAGCQSNLPRYSAMTAAEAMSTMRQRNRAMQSLSAPCRIVLTDQQGRGVELSGALVATREGQLRLRAWKLSQPVFDLTRNAEGWWLWEPEGRLSGEAAADMGLSSARGSAMVAHFAILWTLMTGEFGAGWMGETISPDRLHVERTDDAQMTLACTVAAQTLTTTHCSVTGDDSTPQAEIKFSAYGSFGPYVLPARIDAAAQGRRFTILLDDISINDELSDQVFAPPTAAVLLR